MGKDSCLPVQGTEETWVRSLDQEDPLEEEMATHSSILVWRIPWTKEPGRLSPWGCKEADMTEATEYARTTLIYQVELKNKEVKF